MCLTLCDPMDCRLPGFPVDGIFQARVLEWVAISFSRASSQPRDRTRVSLIVGRHFTVWATSEVRPFYGDPKAPDNTLPCLTSLLLSLTPTCGCWWSRAVLASVQCRGCAGLALAAKPLNWPYWLPGVPSSRLWHDLCAVLSAVYSQVSHPQRNLPLPPQCKTATDPMLSHPILLCYIFFLST